MEKSKYYYEYDRNMDITQATPEELKRINALETANERNIPDYYIGKHYKYEARKVCEDWDLSYNVGTATTYLLRCGKKSEKGMTNKEKHIEDLKKAINHLKFEVEKLENER
jgi:hypothetical protein